MKKTSYLILFALLIIAIIALSLSNIIDETLGMCIALVLIVIFMFLVAITAYKHDVKIVLIIMVVLMTIGVILLGYNIYSILTKEEENILSLTVKESTTDKTKIFSYKNSNYYTYNLSEVLVSKNDKTETLENALTKGLVTLEDILSLAIPSEDTVGYKIYYDGGSGEHASDAYSIVICESSDIIFAPYTYNYSEKICSNASN